MTEGATAPSSGRRYKDSEEFETPVVCKCGLECKTPAAAKVHFLVMSIMPWKHVKINASAE